MFKTIEQLKAELEAAQAALAGAKEAERLAFLAYHRAVPVQPKPAPKHQRKFFIDPVTGRGSWVAPR